MSEPHVPAKQPTVLELAAGDYFWCACGKSGKQPFCDGSHQGSEFAPMKFTLDEPTRFAVCQCKHTGSPPRCDGSHKAL